MTQFETPIRIAILIPQFPSQTHAFFWNEIRCLEEMGVEVHIFSTRHPIRSLVSHAWSEEAAARTTYLNTGSLKEKGEAVFRLPLWLRALVPHGADAASLKTFAISAPAALALRNVCRVRGITHVHAHSAATSAMVAALSKLAGGPEYSVTLHGPMKDYGPAQSFKWAHAHFGIVITRKIERELRETIGAHVPRDLFICSMGVDTDRFRPARPYIPWDGDGPLRLFSCARLNRVKGHDTAIAAVSLLKERGILTHLTIAGEDEMGGSGYRRELDEIIARSPVADRITLLGAVSADRVLEEVQNAHAFVLASHAEPLGVAYMEAMACGCPTIGTNAGGVTELIDDGADGLLVPPHDAEALASAIARIAKDTALAQRLSEAGRTKIVEGYGMQRSARIIAEASSAR